MKILLVNPSQKNVYGIPLPPPYPQLGLLYIAAVLEREHQEVKILDMDIERVNTEKLLSAISNFKPDLIGLTAVTPTFNSAIHIAKAIKKIFPIPIVLGGIHAICDPEGSISEDCIDFLVKGEGEKTICEFLKNFNSGDLKEIPGLWYKENGNIIKNSDRELIANLDELPFPSMHLLPNPNAYTTSDTVRNPVFPIITTRGCPGRCTFCCTERIFGKRVRARSIENVIDEISYLVKCFGAKEIHVMDDCFTYNKPRTLDFCELVKRRGFDLNFCFSNGLRVDYVDYDILKALKEIGTRYVMFGVESGNNQILKNLKKGISLEKVAQAFRLAKKLKFETWACFIIGSPGETEETVKDTIKFAKEIDPDFAKFLILKPYPGTAVFEQLNRENLIMDYNFDHYGVYTSPVHRLPTMQPEEMDKWQRKATREFYFRLPKFIKYILRIKTPARIRTTFAGIEVMLGIMRKSKRFVPLEK